MSAIVIVKPATLRGGDRSRRYDEACLLDGAVAANSTYLDPLIRASTHRQPRGGGASPRQPRANAGYLGSGAGEDSERRLGPERWRWTSAIMRPHSRKQRAPTSPAKERSGGTAKRRVPVGARPLRRRAIALGAADERTGLALQPNRDTVRAGRPPSCLWRSGIRRRACSIRRQLDDDPVANRV
jgi:hypothetical protein